MNKVYINLLKKYIVMLEKIWEWEGKGEGGAFQK